MFLVGGVRDHGDDAFLVDVGFGEPAAGPLRYSPDSTAQITAEGMESRLRLVEAGSVGEGGLDVHLEWRQGGEWAPRLMWHHFDPVAALYSSSSSSSSSSKSLSLESFQAPCDLVTSDSIFTKKLITCLVTLQEKTTLAGTKLKITTPRFGPNVTTTLTQLPDVSAVKATLHDRFGIAENEVADLDLSASLAAAPEVWGHL